MAFFGLRNEKLPYDMFDLARSADEAKRFAKCERIYHRGQQLAWNGREILPMLVEKHGGVHIDDERKQALVKILTPILWGELAAWKISAQLADRLVSLEAKMAATSQAFDEARHFYVMHDYFDELGEIPPKLARAPEALIGLVLGTDNLAHKLLGMQLMLESFALTIFQTLREKNVEPVLSELLTYFERDEARHVGLGMQYFPAFLAEMGRFKFAAMVIFQAKVLGWGLMYSKQLEPALRTLDISPQAVFRRSQKKQLAALERAFEVVGISFDRRSNVALTISNAATKLLFRERGLGETVGEVWDSLWRKPEEISLDEFAPHHEHVIKTADGTLAEGDREAMHELH